MEKEKKLNEETLDEKASDEQTSDEKASKKKVVPEKALWVIGDIHGMYDPLRRIVDRIRGVEYYKREWSEEKQPPGTPQREEPRPKDTTLIFIGDYIDYGPSSKQVIDLLLELKKEFKCVFLCGNHEDMMLQFMKRGELFERFGNMWFRNTGGQNTVVSFMPQPEIYRRVYGTNDDERKFVAEDLIFDQAYLDFFNSMVYSHTETLKLDRKKLKFIFSHANLIGKKPDKNSYSLRDTTVTLEEQLAIKTYDDFHKFRLDKKIWIEDLHIWNRTIPSEKFDDYILIHGHTPTTLYDQKYTEKEYGKFKPDSILPYIRFTKHDEVEFRKEWHKLIFNAPIKDIISINIDTGAAYGKALTAIYLKESELLERSFRVYRTFLNVPRIEPNVDQMEFTFYER